MRQIMWRKYDKQFGYRHVNAELDLGTYEKGIKIPDHKIKDLEATQLHRHEFHPDWNYSLGPATRPNTPT